MWWAGRNQEKYPPEIFYRSFSRAGKGLACNGQGILPAANVPTCPDIQEYTTCGSCQATCENPNPICNMMCHVGCYCPRDTPLFDDAQGKCITSDKCPAANECEASIKADYLDSGNVPAKCSDTSGGAVCATKCASATCVPRKNFPGADKLEAICARFTEDSCGKDQLARNCEWAPAVPEGSRPAKKAVIFFRWAYLLISLGG